MEEKMLFECECGGRNHIIQAYKDEDSVYLSFECHIGDWDADRWYDYTHHNIIERSWIKFGNFFRRKWWRIKKAIRILFLGYMEIEDSWLPVRREDGELFGIAETRKLCAYLLEATDEIEAAYKKEKKKKK